RVGAQIVEAIRAHEPCTRQAAFERAGALFELVGLKPEWLRRYPHEFSGGMRQRAIIAMALALDPSLIIADEPTTALDVVMQDQVYAQIERIRRDSNKALILITHDISLVAENCDRVAVMYAGRIVETAPVRPLLTAPMHPYTIGLRNAFPDLHGHNRELISIPGAPPSLVDLAAGCSFAPRCPFARERCLNEAPALTTVESARQVACHYAHESEAFRTLGALEKTWEPDALLRSGEVG
ncbi:MAG: ABC transporter ATP-binding protein, partial [Betaproteobacteria bacterium]|nr:ABC transporter ATP-binding protein [Betaproteobacteria bacterium]